MNDRSGETAYARVLVSLLLLWLAGVALRLTILAVPPVIPNIHDELQLSQTEVGILNGLPPLLFALAAVPGSLLIARLGALTALVTGLLLTAIGSALRGALPNVTWLYTTTILMGIGVAVMQVTMPPMVRAWLPTRIGFATAVYTNGLLVGEILPVALMLPLVLPLAGGSWQWSFVVWSVPVALIAVLVVALAPRSSSAEVTAVLARRKWWPDWRDGMVWRIGLMFGTANAMYFATNAFLPNYLNYTGRPELISGALTSLNVGQLPASFLLLAVAGRLERVAWPYVFSGFVGLLGVVGIVFGTGLWIIASAALLGFSAAWTLILALALPPLLSAPDDVHRTTAAMFTISYTCAVIVPVVSGLLWDHTGIPAIAFLPIGICGLGLMALAPGIDRAGKVGGAGRA